MSILCRVLGHKLDRNALCYGGIYACRRCGVTTPERLPAQWEIPTMLWRRLKTWAADNLARCPDCGWRFLRHDPEAEHDPF
jgi:DNA-directed RNA polymerase subunit RPC12/RpoP